MSPAQQAARAGVLEHLVERFAPINEEELALAALDGDLPPWVLVEADPRQPERTLVLPLQRFSEIPHDQLKGWSPLAVVGLDCDVAYVPAATHKAGAISLNQLLGW
jgi:hypothetical protein